MDLIFFVKGLVLGFSIAAPVGPMGVLCIRRTLAAGMAAGFITGLGTATADALYGSIAALGVTVVANILLDNQLYLRLLGGLFLLYLGYKTFRSVPAAITVQPSNRSFLSAYSSAFLLTVTNPLTIMSFAAVFAGLGLGSAGGNHLAAGLLVAGVFSGSLVWWLGLCTMVNLLRYRLNEKWLKWINYFSGLIIAGFGLASLITL